MELSGSLRFRLWIVGFLLFSACLGGVYALPPMLTSAQQNGVNWLTAQVQTDGSLAAEASSVATPFQSREEADLTLATLATAPSPLSAAVVANTDTNVEYIARRIIAAASTNQSAATDVAALLTLQNTDGGWGVDSDFQSDALDTAWALQALAAAKSPTSSPVSTGLAYLAQAKNSDGGWGINGQSSVYVTSYALLAANAWATQYVTSTTTVAANTWLLAHRGSTQTFSTTLDNALGLPALATQTAQSATLQPQRRNLFVAGCAADVSARRTRD